MLVVLVTSNSFCVSRKKEGKAFALFVFVGVGIKVYKSSFSIFTTIVLSLLVKLKY